MIRPTSKPLILFAALSLGMASVSAAASSSVRILARELTGELELVNSSGEIVSISGYTIESDAGNLLPDDWTPITGRLDMAGSGSFDPNADWIVFSAPGSIYDLSEGAVLGSGGTLLPGARLSLGDAWDPTGLWDLTATVVVNDVSESADVLYSPIGDYNLDGAINFGDFFIFQSTYGSTVDLRADGNNDGIVNASDYAVWRDAESAAAASLLQNAMPPNGVTTVPEPESLSLILAIMMAAMMLAPTPRESRPAPLVARCRT